MDPQLMVAPNLNGKVYREFLPQQNIVNTFLDFIDIRKSHALLGSSNLNGRYWDGSICYFQQFSVNSTLDLIDTYQCTDVGVTDGKLLPPNFDKAIIGLDSGEIKLIDIRDNGLEILKISSEEHDDYITELSFGSDGSNFVTSSADMSIKIWNTSNDDPLNCLHTYKLAHSQSVSSVNMNPIDSNIFVSCSYDKTALIWDIRSECSGNVLYENEFCALTKIEYNPSNGNLVCVGTSAGDVYMLDVREPNEFVAKNSCCGRSVHRTRFNTNGLLAVCADDSVVRILDANDNMKLIYMNDSHHDFVRGLAWMDDTLVSCGWDKKIYFHYI